MFEALAVKVKKGAGRRWGALSFGASSITLGVATMVCGVAILRWIGPGLMGVWIQTQLLRVWMDALRVGVPNGLNRELPELLGRGESERAEAVAATALAVTGLTSLAGAGLFAVAAVWGGAENGWEFVLAVLAAGAAWVVGGYGQFLRGTMRSSASFRRLTSIQFFESALALGSLPMVAQWGFRGLCARGILLAVIPVALLHMIRPMRVRPVFSAEAFRRICSSGVPQYATNYLLALAASADRTLLLALAQGAQLAGVYAPALAIGGAMATIPGSLTVYMYPRIVHRFGQTGEGRNVRLATRRMVHWNLLVLAPVGSAGVLLSPCLVRTFFPAYEDGILAMQLMAGASVLHAFKANTVVFATLKAWRLYFLFAVTALGASYCCVFLGIAMMSPLTGAAVGMSASLGLGAICLTLLARRALGYQTRSEPFVE